MSINFSSRITLLIMNSPPTTTQASDTSDLISCNEINNIIVVAKQGNVISWYLIVGNNVKHRFKIKTNNFEKIAEMDYEF